MTLLTRHRNIVTRIASIDELVDQSELLNLVRAATLTIRTTVLTRMLDAGSLDVI